MVTNISDTNHYAINNTSTQLHSLKILCSITKSMGCINRSARRMAKQYCRRRHMISSKISYQQINFCRYGMHQSLKPNLWKNRNMLSVKQFISLMQPLNVKYKIIPSINHQNNTYSFNSSLRFPLSTSMPSTIILKMLC